MNMPERTDGPHDAAHFEALFGADADPWHYRSRWYEERKRALTMACLPARRYRRGFEPACANGELSAMLASRCDELLVCDGSASAVAISTARLAEHRHVQVQQAWLPAGWPAGRFDLIVLSEFAYYLGAKDVDAVATLARASLEEGGTIVACHWRWPIAGCALSGDAVHERIAAALALPRLGHCVEADLRIDVWSSDARSVAQRDGFI
jgi:SAM-dependent methyltransferase